MKMDDVMKASFCYQYTNDSLPAFYQQAWRDDLYLPVLLI